LPSRQSIANTRGDCDKKLACFIQRQNVQIFFRQTRQSKSNLDVIKTRSLGGSIAPLAHCSGIVQQQENALASHKLNDTNHEVRLSCLEVYQRDLKARMNETWLVRSQGGISGFLLVSPHFDEDLAVRKFTLHFICQDRANAVLPTPPCRGGR